MGIKKLWLGVLLLFGLAACSLIETAAGPQLPTQGPATRTATTEPKLIATGKVGICHRTGSEKNPWEFIVVDDNAVDAHRQHGDIIGVSSAADCPKAGPVATLTCTPTLAALPTSTATRTPTPTLTPTRTVTSTITSTPTLTLTIPLLITPTQTSPPSVRC